MAIIASWTKYHALLLGMAIGISPLWAQVRPADSSPLDTVSLRPDANLRFNEDFFEAEKQKNLGNLAEAAELYEDLYSRQPKNATVSFELAQIYLSTEQFGKAVLYAEQAYALDKENQWFALLLSRAYQASGEVKKEIGLYKKLIETFPDEVSLYFDLAQAHERNGDPKKAIESLDQAEAVFGISPDIIQQKQQLYLSMENAPAAIAEVQKLLEYYPEDLDIRGNLAKLYQLNGFEEQAVAEYRSMLQIDPDDPRPHLDLANFYQTQKQLDSSLYHLEKAMGSPQLDIDSKIEVLLSLIGAGRLDSNLAKRIDPIFSRIVELHSEDPKAFALYGDWLSQLNRAPEALQAYKQAIRLPGGNRYQIWEQLLLIQVQMGRLDSLAKYAPQAVDLYPNQALPYLFSGMALNAAGKYRDALGYLEDGLTYALGNSNLKEEFYLQLAETHHRLKSHSESDAYFDRALLLNANNASTLNNYAYYLSLRGEQLDKALKMTEKSNMLRPNNPTFLDTWAWVLYQKGEFALAEEKMKVALASSSKPDPELLLHYGDILKAQGKNAEAEQAYQQAKAAGASTELLNNRIGD